MKIWNDTVANLTLMALGSSAPEIMLSCIELFGKGFKAGDLGPSTIVGSASLASFRIIFRVEHGNLRELDVAVSSTLSLCFAAIFVENL